MTSPKFAGNIPRHGSQDAGVFRGRGLISRNRGNSRNRRDPRANPDGDLSGALERKGRPKRCGVNGTWKSDFPIVAKKRRRRSVELSERRGEPSKELVGGKDEPYTEMETHLLKTSTRAGSGVSQPIIGRASIRVTCLEEPDAVTPHVRFCEGDIQ